MSHRTIRPALAAVAAVAVLGLTAACGTSGPSGAGAPAAAGSAAAGKGSASVWIMSGVTEKTFKDSFDRWNGAHPDQSFTSQSFANDAYKQKVHTAIGAGQAPTLIYSWGGGTLRQYAKNDVVVDLSPLAQDPAFADKFLPSVLATGEVDGKTYALPNNGTKPVMIYFNKDVFSKLGLQPPATWDDLMAMVPKLVHAGIAPFTVAGQAQWPLLPYLAYLVDRIGGPEVFANIAADKPDAWSDPAVTEALKDIQQLVDAGGFQKGFASTSTDSGADVALLYSGKAAMTLGLPSAYQTMLTADPAFVKAGKVGIIPFPAVTGGKGDPKDVTGNTSNYWSVSASASKADQQAAEDYLKAELSSPDYVSSLLATGNIPAVKGIDDQLAKTDQPEYYETLYKAAEDAPSFQLSIDQALAPNAATALTTNLQQIFLKQLTPQQFVDAMNKTIGQG